jgi:hypothetical protein
MENPKDKAKELLNKMLSKNPNRQDGISMIDTIQAKQCALIAVDEIINCDSFFKTLEDTKAFTKYWYEVQTEINKL